MDNSRLEDLRRRVQKDPASIVFAQLAEEYRRAGQYAEAVATCRAGLRIHPGYLSARVTLGRSLVELGELDAAQRELEAVLKSASENLAAIRGLAEIHHRRGDLSPQVEPAPAVAPTAVRQSTPPPGKDVEAVPAETSRALRTVAALEQWLSAIHALRPEQRA
jgi:predicted Zn-dependent protease